jgi:hypothetical protein
MSSQVRRQLSISPTPTGPAGQPRADHRRFDLRGRTAALLFKVLAMVAKFEADLFRMRTGKG